MANQFLSVNLFGTRKLLQDLEAIPDTVRGLLREKMILWTNMMRDQVVANITERLKVRTGKLVESVRVEIIEEGLKVDGRVYIAGVPYAVAQEKGAIIPPHMIYPVNAKALAFLAATGDKVFAMKVFYPGGVIPPKNFVRDAYRFISPKITRGLRYQIVERIRAKMGAGI